jgi:hypothetical protein
MSPFLAPRLLVALTTLLALASSVSAAGKKCIDSFDSLTEILNQAKNANVFVRVEFANNDGDDGDDDDDTTQYQEVCNSYERASDQRKEAVVIGKVSGEDQEELAKQLRAENNESSSSSHYVLIKKGAVVNNNRDGLISSKHLIHYDGEPTAKALIEYLKEETGATIGNFVFSLGLMDALAAQFVKVVVVDDDDDMAIIANDFKKRVLAYSAKFLSYTLHIRASEEIQAVVEMYVRVFFQSLTQADYASQQTARIQKLMENSSENMSAKKREQMGQKLHVLTKFTNPQVTPEQERQFYISVGLNIVMLVLVVIVVIQFIFGVGDDEEEPQSDETKEVEGEEDTTKED